MIKSEYKTGEESLRSKEAEMMASKTLRVYAKKQTLTKKNITQFSTN